MSLFKKTAAGNLAQNQEDMQRRINDARALGIQATSFGEMTSLERDNLGSISPKAHEMDNIRSEKAVQDAWMGIEKDGPSINDNGTIDVGDELSSFKSSYNAAQAAENTTFLQKEKEQQECEAEISYNDAWGLAD